MATCPEHALIAQSLNEIKAAQARYPGWLKWALGIMIPLIVAIVGLTISMISSAAVHTEKLATKSQEMIDVQHDLKGMTSRLDKLETKIDLLLDKTGK